jgi:HD-GYP domain-containing protein (c-di-GMP phosphodiesterase class II)
MIDIVTRNTDQLNLLDALNAHSDWIYAHSVGTALFAIMITKEMSMTSTQSFYNLGMAGLFHEISFKDLPKNITEKPQSQLTAEENALFETHPTMSRDILACLESSNGDILQLVYEHHEDQSGQGYPRHVGKNKLHPLSKIFLTADAFSTLVIKNPIHKQQTAQEAIETLKNVYKDKLDPVTIAALANLVKHNKIGKAPPATGENV